MVFADGDHPSPSRIQNPIGISIGTLRGECNRLSSKFLTIEPLITIVREHNEFFTDQICAAAILVNAGPNAEGIRCDILDSSFPSPAHQHASAGLLRSRLYPIEMAT
jgi:hypothetical protein